MSNYPERFNSRHKVNPELISRYEWDARFYGDKNIKNELACAKRTATTLAKSRAQFSHLKPEHKLALDAAASAMASLVADLTVVAAWAKDYGNFMEIERKREEVERLEAFAAQRWGADNAAVAFEIALIAELATDAGLEALGEWMHARGMQTDIRLEGFRTPRFGIKNQPPKNKLEAAESLLSIQNCSPHIGSTMAGSYYYCGTEDYELYLQYKKNSTVAMRNLINGLTLETNS
jgi:hypothetical protein